MFYEPNILSDISLEVDGTPKIVLMITLYLPEISERGNDCNDSELFVIQLCSLLHILQVVI